MAPCPRSLLLRSLARSLVQASATGRLLRGLADKMGKVDESKVSGIL